jgi:hypothetical protein
LLKHETCKSTNKKKKNPIIDMQFPLQKFSTLHEKKNTFLVLPFGTITD